MWPHVLFTRELSSMMIRQCPQNLNAVVTFPGSFPSPFRSEVKLTIPDINKEWIKERKSAQRLYRRGRSLILSLSAVPFLTTRCSCVPSFTTSCTLQWVRKEIINITARDAIRCTRVRFLSIVLISICWYKVTLCLNFT